MEIFFQKKFKTYDKNYDDKLLRKKVMDISYTYNFVTSKKRKMWE
jgi:hypothetical protein